MELERLVQVIALMDGVLIILMRITMNMIDSILTRLKNVEELLKDSGRRK